VKRICVFYRLADKWVARETKIEWIVCKECQRKVSVGRRHGLMRKAMREY
jgi:hypothetical protein